MNDAIGHAIAFCILIYAAKKMAEKYKETQAANANKQLTSATVFGVRG